MVRSEKVSAATRVWLLVGLLAAGVVGQFAMRAYLEAAGPLPELPLERPLADLPQQIGDWHGLDRPIEDERLLYGDDHLQRQYVSRDGKHAVFLWMAYSREGTDRGHHPEVCMRVAGQPEDANCRRTLTAAGFDAPIQHYRFGRPGGYQRIYYWYYTLPPSENDGVSQLQRLYQRMRRRPSSLTIEVFAPELADDVEQVADEFVLAVDQAVQEIVGPHGVRGSRRLPVTIIEGAPGG